MHFGQYVFTQIARFLPKRYFERLVAKSSDRTKNWTPSPWSQLLVLMFRQLIGCKGLSESGAQDILYTYDKGLTPIAIKASPNQRLTVDVVRLRLDALRPSADALRRGRNVVR